MIYKFRFPCGRIKTAIEIKEFVVPCKENVLRSTPSFTKPNFTPLPWNTPSTLQSLFSSVQLLFQMSLFVRMSLAVIVMTLVFLPPPSEAGSIGQCWDTWSRCTRWSHFASGIAWQKCPQRCVCLGHATGRCVMTPSSCPLSNKAWQCQCSGRRNGPKPSWCGS